MGSAPCEPGGRARFVGHIDNDHEIIAVLYGQRLSLYHLDPPLAGYRVVAAGGIPYPTRAVCVGDLPPDPRDDPVTTYLFGTTGGERLRIVWPAEIYRAEGRSPARALADAGYRLR